MGRSPDPGRLPVACGFGAARTSPPQHVREVAAGGKAGLAAPGQSNADLGRIGVSSDKLERLSIYSEVMQAF